MNGDDYKTYEEIEANIKRFAKSNELTFNFNKNTSAFRAIIKIIKNIAYWFQSMQISVENNLSRDTCDEVACIRYHGPIAGVVKKGATKTKQPMQITTSGPGNTDGLICCDENGAQYVPSKTYTFDGEGVFEKDINDEDIIFEAVEYGPQKSDLHSINTIIAPKANIVAVDNIKQYTSLGELEESEESFRNRINNSPRNTNVVGTTETIERDLLNITGVAKAKVYSNPTPHKVFDMEKGTTCICVDGEITAEIKQKITKIIATNDMTSTKQDVVYDNVDYSIMTNYVYNNSSVPVIFNKTKHTDYYVQAIIYGKQEYIDKLNQNDLKEYIVENINKKSSFMTYDFELSTKQYKITGGFINSNDILQIILDFFNKKQIQGLSCGDIRLSKTGQEEPTELQIAPEHLNELLQVSKNNINVEIVIM